MSRHLLAFALALSNIPTGKSIPLDDRSCGDIATNFTQVEPSSDLKWTPCYKDHLCALLTVPLDYSNETAGTTDIAFLKRPALNITGDTQDIILNGGGPGVETIKLLLLAGDKLSSMFGPQYSLVALDPRGVGNSGPDLSCFPKNPAGEALWQASVGERVADSTDDVGLRQLFAIQTATGKWCSKVHRNGPGRYATTHAIAEDILHFTELQAAANGKDPKEAKIWYYGGSYGTALGQTIATLFPHRIGRMLLDSVLDPDIYYNGTWLGNIADSDASMQDFFQKCHQAGSKYCPVHANSTRDVERRVRAIIESIRKQPLQVSEGVPYPKAVNYGTLNAWMLLNSYGQSTFPQLAAGLRSIEEGNGSSVAFPIVGFTQIGLSLLANSHISCLDAAGRGQIADYDDFVLRARRFHDVSPWVGASSYSTVSGCIGRDIRPVPSQIIHDIGVSNMSTPILFVAQTLDPATPLHDAHMVSSTLFPGSVVLEQKANGHGMYGFNSKCIDAHIQHYFSTGQLPPVNSTCETETIANPFLDPRMNPLYTSED